MASVRQLGLFPTPSSNPICPRFAESQDVDLSDISMLGAFDEATRLNAWMTLEQAMAFVWRVKSWKITHSSSFTILSEEGDIGPFPLNYEETLQNKTVFSNPPQNPTRETDVICGLRGLEYGYFEGLVGNMGGAQGYNMGNISFHPSTNSFRPDVYVQRTGAIYFYPQIFDPVGLGIDDRPPFYGEIGSATLQIGAVGYNQSFPVYIYSYPSDGGTVGDFSHTIAATEYWPYDPGDGGGPIYDSTTGAQLRPFPG
jgi:hypothetical protein